MVYIQAGCKERKKGVLVASVPRHRLINAKMANIQLDHQVTGQCLPLFHSKHTCVCFKITCVHKNKNNNNNNIANRFNRKVKAVDGHFRRQYRCREICTLFFFSRLYIFFVKHTSICLISDQICLQNCEKILKAKFTNSDDDPWSLGNTVY